MPREKQTPEKAGSVIGRRQHKGSDSLSRSECTETGMRYPCRGLRKRLKAVALIPVPGGEGVYPFRTG